MKAGYVAGILISLTACVVLDGKRAEKPAGTHYSAAYIRNSSLVVFPFDGPEARVDLPANVGGFVYSASGRTIYGLISSPGTPGVLVAVKIKPGRVEVLPGSKEFSAFSGWSVDAAEDEMIVSAAHQEGSSQRCGLFKLGLKTGEVEHIVDNLDGECGGFVSSWSHLSLSPDGRRAVGTAKKGQLGLVNVKEHRIERLWRGTRACWSPDGKWIAALTFDLPTRIQLIDANNFSNRGDLGKDNGVEFTWSPDSKYLLLWKAGLSCILSAGYVGTYRVLDIETGRSNPIASSRCQVNQTGAGWVSDAVIR